MLSDERDISSAEVSKSISDLTIRLAGSLVSMLALLPSTTTDVAVMV